MFKIHKSRRMRMLRAVIVLVVLSVYFSVQTQVCMAQENEDYGNDIVVALDVSGSMISTDQDRLSIEMIQMIVDTSSEKDRIAVVAYNDYVVYQSELLSMDNEQNKMKLKQDAENLVFSGETDNGLGLKTAIDKLKDAADTENNRYVIFISDGKTDLVNSASERTEEQSSQDWNDSVQIAKDKGIVINTISFVNEYSQDTNQMTIASNQTGGESRVVANPLQFVEAFIKIVLGYRANGDVNVNTENVLTTLSKAEFSLEDSKTGKTILLVVATSPFEEIDILSASNEVTLNKNKHYVFSTIQNLKAENLSVMYSCEEEGVLLWCAVDIGTEMEEPVAEEPEEETEEAVITHPPVATQKMEKELYIPDGTQKFDVSDLFRDEDGDITGYQISVDTNADMEAKISGSMLEVYPVSYEDVIVRITAVDSADYSATNEILFHCIPIWKRHYQLIVTLIILGMILFTGVICLVLWRLLFHTEAAEKGSTFHGRIVASFVDLKSKNDIPKLIFPLKECSPNGVTLKELMAAQNISEDLPDTEKIVFYPYSRNEIVLVHDSAGGIFVEDEPLERGKELRIESGMTIFVAFAENASEYELRYEAKGL